ncbi:DUF523 domain-containing protein [Psychrobacter sp. F1192]|uniref:DUF523 domain-containing protein n=1 Tax=Psychrobacter coccoides TaxID=2818440 RepID=A0ABS3NPH1_9GAMM|nr:DUF523 domain-containing protein [Psychrobacter coccoides]MBO1531296.1 DUF523 domain-containing protein [Psychrobacter coccoides]
MSIDTADRADSKTTDRQALLVSACLLGQRVRYDGNHAQLANTDLMAQLQASFILIPICPELLGGLSTPRPPAEISQQKDKIEVISITGTNLTKAFDTGARRAGDLVLHHGIKWALLKSKSPSCGRGSVYDGSFTGRLRAGDGVTAQYIQGLGVQVFNEHEIEALLTGLVRSAIKYPISYSCFSTASRLPTLSRHS